MIQGHSRRWARSIHDLRVQPGLGNVISWYKMRRWQWELEGVPNPCWCRFCYPMRFPKSLSPIVSVDTLSAVRNHVWDWRAKPLHPTSSGKTLHHNLSSSHSCRKPEYLAIFYWSAWQIKPSQRTASFVTMTNIPDLTKVWSQFCDNDVGNSPAANFQLWVESCVKWGYLSASGGIFSTKCVFGFHGIITY